MPTIKYIRLLLTQRHLVVAVNLLASLFSCVSNCLLHKLHSFQLLVQCCIRIAQYDAKLTTSDLNYNGEYATRIQGSCKLQQQNRERTKESKRQIHVYIQYVRSCEPTKTRRYGKIALRSCRSELHIYIFPLGIRIEVFIHR